MVTFYLLPLRDIIYKSFGTIVVLRNEVCLTSMATIFKGILLPLFFLLNFTISAQKKEDIVGYWKSCDEDDNMVVKVKIEQGFPVGYLVGFQNDDGTWESNKPKKGIKVMYNFAYKGNLKWNKGKIYDPIADRTYRGVVRLQSKDTIKAVGYWGFLWDDIFFKRIPLNEKDEPNG